MKTTRVARWIPVWSYAVLLILHLGYAPLAHAAASQTVPMQQLLADPQRIEGHQVRTTGFLRLEFEANALYQTRDDFNNAVREHAVWLDLTNAQLRRLGKLNNGHVVVEGVFSAQYKGHGGKWAGALHPVTDVRMWRKPRRH
jgi:hypothetical protein